MSYDIIARSVDDARPFELYQITYSGQQWYYTSGDRPITYSGVLHIPIVCDHEDIEPSTDVFANGLPVRFERSAPFAEIFRIAPPSEKVGMRILATNYLVDNEFVVIWQGRIVNVEWTEGWVKLTTESIYSSLQQAGLRRRYSRTCPHVLYGNGCGLSREIYRERSTTQGVNGVFVSVQAAVGKPDNHYAGGFVTWTNSLHGNVEKRMVRQSVGATGVLTLAGVALALSGGQAIDMYPGCDHQITTCANKFNNTLNYGGQPYIPTKNPFNGASLF